jgi:hypothetical protein
MNPLARLAHLALKLPDLSRAPRETGVRVHVPDGPGGDSTTAERVPRLDRVPPERPRRRPVRPEGPSVLGTDAEGVLARMGAATRRAEGKPGLRPEMSYGSTAEAVIERMHLAVVGDHTPPARPTPVAPPAAIESAPDEPDFEDFERPDRECSLFDPMLSYAPPAFEDHMLRAPSDD